MLQRPGADSLPFSRERSKHRVPDFACEEYFLANGHRLIAGVDEAGRGPLAGPVVAAAVILDPAKIPCGLNDSKKLTRTERLECLKSILDNAVVSWRACEARVIDHINIRQATLRAMTGAVCGLPQQADAILIDGNDLPQALSALPHVAECRAVIGGDAVSVSIAAASIVAKCIRDAIMDLSARTYPDYGFERHAGYGTALHLSALHVHGPCPLHRRSFAPVRLALEKKRRP